MRGKALVLLCALALAKADPVRSNTKQDVLDRSDPKQAQIICASSNSEGVQVAHEHCNQFYKCSHGTPVVFSCSGELLYNLHIDVCDWPQNVDCGTRSLPESEGHEHETNPEEAVTICAAEGSRELQLPHRQCNRFYKCEDGKPVTFRCPGNLLYNTIGEYCDCADNVICDGREVTEDNDNGSSENDNTVGNGDGNNDPSLAPEICAADDSDGILVAHENCNKFYKCAHGIPEEFKCYGNLHFNPDKDHCDWPENVDCGDRVIPDEDCEEDDVNNESETTTENEGVDNENGNTGGDSNEGNGENEGSEDGGGSGTCNCNPGEAPQICATDGSEGVLVAHENCNQFYVCVGGSPVTQTCPSGLLFNPYQQVCDWPSNVECGDRVIPEDCDEDNNESETTTENVSTGDGNGDNGGDVGNGGSEDGGGSGTCNCNPGEAPQICATAGSEGVLVAHENCNQFYVCVGGSPVTQTCPSGLLFNPYQQVCDWPNNVECGDRVIPEDCDDDNNESETTTENVGIGNENGDNGGDGSNGGSGDGGGSGTCNCNPGEAPQICAAAGSEGVLVAHENCNQFYVCVGGSPVTQTCPSGLLFNPYQQVCDWPNNVECGDRVIPEDCDDDNNESETTTENVGTGNENSGNGGDGGNGGSEDGGGSGTCNCNPGEAPQICAIAGSEGVLVAHENCNQFYVCVGGSPVTQTCPSGLLFNPYQQVCDWPSNVECGDRVIPEDCDEDNNESETTTENVSTGDGNGDNNGDGGNGGSEDGGGSGTCNCNPGEAPQICATAGSEGVLVAHENCNQFYVCVGGSPVTQICPSGLLFNPYQQVCDWPNNVECGDRVIPEDCDDDNNESETTTENVGIGNENGDNGGDGSNGGSGDGGGSGTCNCNPGEAPQICAAAGSEGVLVAHENCNQFYVCVGGSPATQTCPSGLLFNPFQQVCDWPSNVECGDRVIPEDCDDDNNESETTTENVSTGDENGDNGGEGGNGGNEDGGGSGTCNCNPGEAPQICAAAGSEGVLVAHENCNQFYVCVGGSPVTQTCPSDLLFNPYQQVCDWPNNVECGDRVIPEDCDDDNNESETTTENVGTDNENSGNGGDGGNGGSEDGGGSGTCNCNPGEAPQICATVGSEGVLVAHENCNQFYVCIGGSPVTQTCPSGLLFNPYQQVCDWPRNVECGDRVIPEDCDDDNNESETTTENVGTGNENGGNGGDGGNGGSEDGGGSGTCNCNPGEAPQICAAAGSEGVLVAHENCNQFYVCVGGGPVTQTCPSGLLFNPYQQVCDWPSNVECGDRVIPEDCNDDDNDTETTTANVGTGNENGGNGGNGGSEDGGASGTCNCNPGEAPQICAADGSEGVLIAHENCNQFYVCVGGSPVTQTCPSGLLFNPYQQVCDWPNNVECGDRVIPEDCDDDNNESGTTTENVGTGNENGGTGGDENDEGDSGGSGTCNCNPGEAPQICAATGSEGVLVAHENCNQFYVCVGGSPVTQTCPSGLLFNPYEQLCDWPNNVECGERVIPEDCDEDNNDSETTTENVSTDNESGDNGGNGGGGSGTCNCNPGEAPQICAAAGSEGVFVAHENCNQFFVCVGGSPVTQTCPSGLLYNPYQQLCDWPNNVECGERVIPEDCDEDDDETEISTENGGNGNGDNGGTGQCNCNPGEAPQICAATGSEGVLVAHENCNQFFVCVGGAPVNQTCPNGLLYNPYQQLCDWPYNVECGDRVIPEDCDEDNNENESTTEDDSNTGSTCNCNPAEAPTICTNAESDGVLVAHENCNQFYVCNGGQPIVNSCPSGLLYNPEAEQCDWPDKVDCGNRNVTEVECEDNEDSKEGSDETNNGDGAGVGDGSFVTPEQAETICSKEDAQGIFLPHLNCNQFYTCVGSRPVVMNCPGDLLYNWQAEACDWPQSVNCGDRIHPDAAHESENEEGKDEEQKEDDANVEESETPPSYEAAVIACSASTSSGLALPHEDCNKFYMCLQNKPTLLQCASDLLFDTSRGQCNWPERVDCGDRLTVLLTSFNKHLEGRQALTNNR